MWRARSTRLSSADPRSGFTLLELLVALAIASAIFAAMGQFFASTLRYRRTGIARVETRQGIRAALDSLARDVRGAGTCLPAGGGFVALGGVDAGTRDTLRIRSGLLANGACVRTVIRSPMPSVSRELNVESTTGFEVGMRVYLLHPNGSGEFFTITAVQTVAQKLQKADASIQDYPVGSGVFALRERTYAIDPGGLSFPILTVTTDDGAAIPLAVGIEALDVRYRLRRNCPACDVVALPASDAEWRLVNSLLLTVTARFPVPRIPAENVTLTETIQTKPRNLLP